MNIGDLFDSPIKVLIIAVVLIVLFGSKKLPDAARSLGKSMRILKREVQDLREDDDEEPQPQPAAAIPAPAPAQPSVDELQRQIRDLQAKAASAEAAKPAEARRAAPRPADPARRRSTAMAKLEDTVRGARVLGARVRAAEAANPDGRMPLMEHLRELRNRLVKVCLALLVGTGIGLIRPVWSRVWGFVEHPFCAAVIHGHRGCDGVGHQLVLTGVLDPFMLRIELAFFFGLILTSPIWLYQLWAFVAPGLYRREKRWAYMFVASAVPLFVLGAALAYVAMSRGLALPARPDPGRGAQPAAGLHLPRLLHRHDARLRAGLRAAAAAADAQRGRGAEPPVLPPLAAGDDLLGVRFRRASPRPARTRSPCCCSRCPAWSWSRWPSSSSG